MTGQTAKPPVIVAMPAEVDLTNQAAVADSLLDAGETASVVIADMTGTTFCDSAGMRMLHVVSDHAAAAGSTLRIVVSPGSSVARALAILGMDRLVSVYTSIQDATRIPPGTSQRT